ncbi:hypersensitive response-inducing protein [Hypoxylon sp. FL0890]|nr:hypersensitive response-inducing protein [Hypoxylon sp. FL0890]
MKFFANAALFAVAAAGAASKRDTVFSVSDFSASCIPHSTQCSYSFTVLQTGTMETTGVSCSATVSGNGGLLPDVKDGTCKDSARTWTVVKGSDGLTLTVSQQISPSSTQSGSHLIPNDQLATSDEPNASVQKYTGPTSFSLTS